ncbi:hypothetical protein [Luteolibacter luteus]|uniref:Uncharacterized protein n=1 Tax=Luteolibacter luteus TaxID=2728835 RepID=A0A858RRE5_9BACT|nr:hypothetical protein [Luteolibacter luteus]QJE99114.1 hypothetical protein HHL09_26155 [Luteolibacter luteus]
MNPKPLPRSITFWSGIFVMLFITWAWWDSFQNYSVAYVRDRIEVQSTQGMMVFGEADQIDPMGGKRVKRTSKLPTKVFPEPVFLRGGGETLEDEAQYRKWDEEMRAAPDQIVRARLDMKTFPRDQVRLMLPYWLFVLAVALPWCGLLMLRARRIRKAASRGLTEP